MNKIYIIINPDSEEENIMLNNHNDSDNCIIAFNTLLIGTVEELKTYFIFNINDQEKCRLFLKRCSENNLDIKKIKIELHIEHEASKI
jgi:hypothetical protein